MRFWRDATDELRAGLLDCGSVGQMDVVQAFYGMTCSTEADFLNAHRRNLIKLSVAVLGIAWIFDVPSLVEAQIPNVHLVC